MIEKKKSLADYMKPVECHTISAEPVDDSIETRITDLENSRADWMEKLDDAETEVARIEGDLLRLYQQFYRNATKAS